MGVKLCRNVQANPEPRNTANNCLEVCHITPTHQNLNNGQEIKPIQFSEDEQQKTPNKKYSDNCRTTTVNNGTSLHFEESPIRGQEYFSNSNFKEKLIKVSNNGEINQPEGQEVLLVTQSNDGHLQYINERNLYKPISVPFSVIKIILRPELIKQLRRFHSNFLPLHGNPNSQTFQTWKLLSNGYYINKVSNGSVIVLNEDKLYDGFALGQSCKPEGNGTLITVTGTFVGKFKQGRSHGNGVFIQIMNETKFDGVWSDGEFQKGRIENEYFSFEGSLRRGVPHGKGQLRLLKRKIEYKGFFKDGLFEDKRGLYTCREYVYHGGFAGGKKNGYGILTPIMKENRKAKYNISEILDGVFENDKFKRSAI